MMKRDIDNVLDQWKDDSNRMPLMIRGARQVGKSFTITAFGERKFENLVTINLEQQPEYKECFSTLMPKEIISAISIRNMSDIIPGKTLLFLDEIQECPGAITALRYFYEQMPELHVIGAGSLLDFVLSEENFRMPVGRVQYLFMKPLSFLEFLDAVGESRARAAIEDTGWDNMINPLVHDHLLSLVKKYAIVGGMPKATAEYASSRDLNRCRRIQTSIIQTYRDDFAKYASRVKQKHLQKIFSAVPKMVGKKFKYSQVDNGIHSRNLKEAVELLEKAGVVYRVSKTHGNGLPLDVNADERHFKAVFVDIGLMQNICGLRSETLMMENFIEVNTGAVAEQFVAQELLAYPDEYESPSLYYWVREARSSSAELDFLIPCLSYPLPVEVKAGKTGTLRSMHLFLDKYPCPVGVRISRQPFSDNPPIISVPFYGIKKISEMVKHHF
ncbi:MAG: ATP-binding protein [bacterium]|nr:ATP-binding protein [bacterium]